MKAPSQATSWLTAARGYGLAALLALPAMGAAAPSRTGHRASRAAKPPSRAGSTPAKGTAARVAPLSLSSRSGVREAGPAELEQFYNELNRHDWHGAQIAVLPRGYGTVHGKVQAVGWQRATLYGDVDGDGAPEWVVGCYFPSEAEPSVAAAAGVPVLPDDRARIVVFKKDAGGRWRFGWRSPGLGNDFRQSEFNMGEVTRQLDRLDSLRLPISLISIDGKKSRDIAYYCDSQSETVGALPGVYHFDGARWVSVAPHSDRFNLQDLDGDGKLEVVAGSRYIGFGSGDDDVPRVWRWNGREYQEASRDFPHFYAHLAQQYEAYVRRMDAAGRSIDATGRRFDRVAWERAIQKASSLAG